MQYGVTMFPADYAIPVPDLAREVEARGFDSLWLPEHTHIPTSRLSPFPGGGDLPEEYKRTIDPFVALGAIAATTTKLKLGTGILLVPERNAILTAKQIASLDNASGGRFLFGIGAGWNPEESAILGGDFPHRWSQVKDHIAAMKVLWT